MSNCCVSFNLLQLKSLPSQLELKNTPTASLQRGKTSPPTSVLDITLNNPMVRFQYCWSTPSLPLLPDPLWPGSNRTKIRTNAELNCLK